MQALCASRLAVARCGRIAKAEAKLEPPQDAVRIAKTAFAAFRRVVYQG
jgi:hypothetical protein